MSRQMPSLNGLRAFEAAGRHGSFKAAAEELNVTQAAVSQMVRLLERHLGFALFHRHANRLELTDQGRSFQPGLTEAFDAIARLSEQVASMQAGPVLTIGVAPTLALHWLIPRLTSFNRNHPNIEVRVATGGAMLPLRDDWTCAVAEGLRQRNGELEGSISELRGQRDQLLQDLDGLRLRLEILPAVKKTTRARQGQSAPAGVTTTRKLKQAL